MNALNKYQENKLTMYEGVDSLLDENNAIVVTIPAFVQKKSLFHGTVQGIKVKGREKQESTSGKTMTKQQAEDALVSAVLEIAPPLYSYARKIKNNEVKEIADVTEYKLRRLRDTELESKATLIHAKAEANAAGLTDYSITGDMIAELGTKITAFHIALAQRESSASERVGITAALNEQFAQADEILTEDIDRIVERLRNSEPEFYAKYQSARMIKDLGIRHEKEEPPSPPPTPAPTP